jgi:hypothetical protein
MKYLIDKSNRLSATITWEWAYMMQIFREIEADDRNSNFNFILTDNLYHIDLSANSSKEDIVFLISDEQYSIPHYHDNVRAIFKNYATTEQEKYNIYPIPQGFIKDLIFLPFKEPQKRTIDLSFQGNPHTTRPIILHNILQEISARNLNLNILFSQSVSSLDYSTNLANTKISLCLDGQQTPESFRFFESCIHGCTIIASRSMPQNWIYEDNFYFKVDWQDSKSVVDIIEHLLNNSAYLENYCKGSYNIWNSKFSANAIKEYIFSKIL